MRMLVVATAILLLGACTEVQSAKRIVYKAAASTGNKYCMTRDPELRDSVVNRVNAGLKEQGARFTFDGITCDGEVE